MRRVTLFAASFLVASLAYAGEKKTSRHDEPIHIELDASAEDYRALQDGLLERLNEFKKTTKIQNVDELEKIIGYGARLLDWVKAINQTRTPDQRIALTSAATQGATPIDAPKFSNETIILQKFSNYRAQMTDEFLQVILGNDPVPNTTSLSDEHFVEQGRELLKIYQSASRWLLQVPYLSYYSSRRTSDIRGYYFLKGISDLSQKLDAWASLDSSTQDQWRAWLVGECLNSNRTQSSCEAELTTAIRTSSVRAYHEKYLPRARSTFDSFFRLESPRRSDLVWGDVGHTKLKAYFLMPDKEDVAMWLRQNIEDEWRLGDFQLQLEFVNDETRPRVKFEPGATPHVNGLGGDTITMDANAPLDDYNVSWTIRHEYGHVLGLPDCYVEFYDETQGVMVSYQIDITNLMCSRRGHLKGIHIEELRKNYISFSR